MISKNLKKDVISDLTLLQGRIPKLTETFTSRDIHSGPSDVAGDERDLVEALMKDPEVKQALHETLMALVVNVRRLTTVPDPDDEVEV